MADALGWILGAKTVVEVEEEEHQAQSLEVEFPKEAWKQVAGEHQLQEVLADVVGPRKKGKWSRISSHPLTHIVGRDKENTLLKKTSISKLCLLCEYIY